MGYVAVRGGGLAIEESLKLLERERVEGSNGVSVDAVEDAFPGLVEQVMGEASLYAPRLAAVALKQAQGSPEEAVFLLRAFRSTLERPYVSREIRGQNMAVERRISAAFKDVLGGQLLGATRDYSHRLIRFDLERETEEDAAKARRAYDDELDAAWAALSEEQREEHRAAAAKLKHMPKVLDYLRKEGLIDECDGNDEDPVDVTMEPLVFPAPRSARLQTLARGMTQGVTTLGYAAIRGFGPSHPTVGELRSGSVEVLVDHPLDDGADENDAYYLGSVPVTEVESVFAVDRSREGKSQMGFKLSLIHI